MQVAHQVESSISPAFLRLLLFVSLIAFPLFTSKAFCQAGAPDGEQALPAGTQMVRGTVTAIGSSQITIKTESGDLYQVALSPETRILKARQPIQLSSVKPGDGAGAAGLLDAPSHTLHALFVAVVDAETLRKAAEGLGKVYITGTITKIQDVQLTIRRPDNVLQTIQVDEDTSFRRGRGGMGALFSTGPVDLPSSERPAPRTDASPSQDQSLTFPDLKVGDFVSGPGALKNGIFIPSQLRVSDPSQVRRGRTASGATPPPPPSSAQPR